MCSFRQIAHKQSCAVVPKLLLVRRGRLIKFSLFHSAIFCLFHLFKFLAIASFCTFSALFEIISNFCMLSFQQLLKSALSFSPKSSYPAQFPEFSVLCFLPQIFVFVARGTLQFLCSQSSSILLTVSQFFRQLCLLLQQKIYPPCQLVRFSHLCSLLCCKYYFFLLAHYQPFFKCVCYLLSLSLSKRNLPFLSPFPPLFPIFPFFSSPPLLQAYINSSVQYNVYIYIVQFS